jgi:Carboxypeptidase regulatory-like domain/TonB-dependent Receptor Plug Domain
VFRKIFSILVLLSFTSLLGIADVSRALISGTVTDSSGGVLPGASVTAKNTATGVSQTTTTNGAGVYQLLDLQPGRYSIRVSLLHFATQQRPEVVLRVGDELRLDFSLAPGGQRETIEVKESAPLAQTESATASTVVNEKAIEELPSDGRELQNFVLITPGVDAGWNVSTAANRYGKARENTEGAFSVDGARARSNDFLFDGMPMNLHYYSVINFEPSDEAVQEFEVLRSIPPAEYGRTMGGQVVIVTRAGTDKYHGSLYEFFRNDVLNANDTFSNRTGLPRGEVRHNQFGGTLGGPIWKDRHFFFVNVELLRNLEASEPHTSFVPTLQERQGLIPYTDANGAQHVLDVSNQIAPVSSRLVGLYPVPNASLPSGNYTTTLPIRLNDYQFTVRTDHHLTERDTITERTSWNLNDQTYIIDRFGGPYIPGFPLVNPEETGNGTLGYFHVFSASMVNEARFGINRYTNRLANGDTRDATLFGLPNGSSANGIPFIDLSRGGLADLGGLNWYNRDQNELTVYASDKLSILRGNHSLKFGGDFSRFQYNTRGATNERGTIFFDGSRNNRIPKLPQNQVANTMADLLLGLPSEATITTGAFGRGYRDLGWALFAQDKWRATRRLTLSYGLRYEYTGPWSEVHNRLSNFLPGEGIVTPGTPGWNGLYHADRNNFAPRFGFAYDVFGTGRTVVHGGFGILYGTLSQASTVQQIENNAPFSAQGVTFSPAPFSQDPNTPTTTLTDLRTGTTPSNSLTAIPQNVHTPYSMQFSLDLEQSIGKGWIVEAAYRGTRGVRLPFDYNINQVPLDFLGPAERAQISAAVAANEDTSPIINPLRPYPAFNTIELFTNEATSTYHSLQLQVEHRLSNSLNLLAAYTYSKSIDNATDFASGDPSEHVLDSYNRRLQRAVSSFDIPQRFTAAFNYVAPSPRWKSFLGNWQVNGIVTLQSGQPFTPFSSAFDPYRNEAFNRPNLVGDPAANVPSGFAYNPAAFAPALFGTFGNSGRNVVRGGSFRSVDLSVFRTFSFRERLKLQFRAEATNALNAVNFQGPVMDLQSPAFGSFDATATPRTLQLGLKLSF